MRHRVGQEAAFDLQRLLSMVPGTTTFVVDESPILAVNASVDGTEACSSSDFLLPVPSASVTLAEWPI